MQKTALYDTHVALGAKMVPFAGFDMPVQYAGITAEHLAVRNQAGLFDVSHMGQFRVKGAGAEAYLQNLTTNDVSALVDGKIQYSAMLNEKGGIIDDLLVYRVAKDHYFVVVNAGNLAKDWDWFNQQIMPDVVLSNESDKWSLLALQGPQAKAILADLINAEIADLPYYTFAEATIDGIEVVISATGYTGAGGYEIMVANADAVSTWNKILAAGANWDIQPAGLAARDTLRLEMGYCLHGNDISENHSPLEAGLQWITKMDTNFIGKAVLEVQKQDGVTRKLVGLALKDRGIPRAGYPIVDQAGIEVGIVTSGTMSPCLKQGIAMGYVRKDLAVKGGQLGITVRNKTLATEIVKMPFIQTQV